MIPTNMILQKMIVWMIKIGKSTRRRIKNCYENNKTKNKTP